MQEALQFQAAVTECAKRRADINAYHRARKRRIRKEQPANPEKTKPGSYTQPKANKSFIEKNSWNLRDAIAIRQAYFRTALARRHSLFHHLGQMEQDESEWDRNHWDREHKRQFPAIAERIVPFRAIWPCPLEIRRERRHLAED